MGKVKEKETARLEYKEAVEAGHGAYLMQEESPEVFSVMKQASKRILHLWADVVFSLSHTYIF